MTESWLPIPGFPGYEVSDMGQVRSYKWSKPRILKPSLTLGYPGVNLRSNGQVYYKKVHQLVMLAFIGPRPIGQEICHNDGNRSNPRLSNLRYDTHSANMRESKRANGPHSLNKTIKQKHLSQKRQRKAEQIRVDYATGRAKMEELSRKYQVNLGSVSQIINGKLYKKAGGPIKGIDY